MANIFYLTMVTMVTRIKWERSLRNRLLDFRILGANISVSSKKRVVFLVIAPLLLFSYFLLISPQNAFNENDVEARFEQMVATSFADTRFDMVDVDIEDGILNIVLEDTAICSESNATFRITRHINLRDFDTVSRRIFNAAIQAAYYAAENTNSDDLRAASFEDRRAAFFMVSVDTNQATRARLAVVSERKDQIYNAAKEELGMGREAGNRTYELFTQSTPELQTMSYVIREKCVDGIGLDLVRWGFSLPIRHENSVEYIKTINYLIRTYAD